jgi:hypothetical protein
MAAAVEYIGSSIGSGWNRVAGGRRQVRWIEEIAEPA